MLQPVRLSVHDLIGSFHEPGQREKDATLVIYSDLSFQRLFYIIAVTEVKKKKYKVTKNFQRAICKLSYLNRSLCPGSFLIMFSL